MNSVRWLLNKYSWMAADDNCKLPVAQQDRAFRPGLSEKEKKQIYELYTKGIEVHSICSRMKRSDTAVRNYLKKTGLYTISKKRNKTSA